YRRRAKQLIYTQKCDAVYLMARDANIAAVQALRDTLAGDGLIEAVDTYHFRLRSDFKTRIMHRESAIIVVLRRRIGAELEVDEAEGVEGQDEEIEVYDAE